MTTRESKTKYSILGTLSFGPKSGYEVKTAMQRSIGHFWSESDGQIYPTLKYLHENRYVDCKEESETGKRAKKVYSITKKGKQYLLEWLKQQPTTFNMRHEFLLQLFFGHNLDTKTNIEKIHDYHFMLKQQLAQYNNIEKQIKERSKYPTYLLLSLSYGQDSLQAEIAWCDKAILLLEKEV